MSNRTKGTSPQLSSEKKNISREEWDRRLSQVSLSKLLVMNYLIVEGYKDAAEKFSQETGVRPMVEFTAIEDRMQVRTCIQTGRLQDAIDRINRLNPDLQIQQFIELVRGGSLSGALEHAQEMLGPMAEANPEFLSELERAMTLFIHDPTGPLATALPAAEMLEPFYRVRTANEVNAAILAAQSQEKDSKLPTMLKLLDWAQTQLETRLHFPKIVDYANATFE